MPESITITTALANSILQFLGTQPYQQVAGLIAAIQKEAQGQMAAEEVSADE